MLPWERFFLAEYYHERERNDEAIEMLDSDPKGGWGDYDTYFFLALAYELKTPHKELARGSRIGPFARGGMAMIAWRARKE